MPPGPVQVFSPGPSRPGIDTCGWHVTVEVPVSVAAVALQSLLIPGKAGSSAVPTNEKPGGSVSVTVIGFVAVQGAPEVPSGAGVAASAVLSMRRCHWKLLATGTGSASCDLVSSTSPGLVTVVVSRA